MSPARLPFRHSGECLGTNQFAAYFILRQGAGWQVSQGCRFRYPRLRNSQRAAARRLPENCCNRYFLSTTPAAQPHADTMSMLHAPAQTSVLLRRRESIPFDTGANERAPATSREPLYDAHSIATLREQPVCEHTFSITTQITD